MGCMWETTGDMGRPLGCSPFPRYLAQHLALVPRAHKAHSGRKVSNSGPAHPPVPETVLPSFLTRSAFCSNGHVPNDAETRPRNHPIPTAPGGRPQGVSAQRNTTAPAEGQSSNTPTPYPRIYARSVCQCLDVYSSKRAHYTL